MSTSSVNKRLRVVVLVGLSGSGKSTLAWKLSQQGWAVLQLGEDVDAAVYEAALLLQKGREVVIDGHMHTTASRMCWILMARAMNEAAGDGRTVEVMAVELSSPVPACQATMVAQGTSFEAAADLLARQQEEYCSVQKEEGFSACARLHRLRAREDWLEKMGQAAAGDGQPAPGSQPPQIADPTIPLDVWKAAKAQVEAHTKQVDPMNGLSKKQRNRRNRALRNQAEARMKAELREELREELSQLQEETAAAEMNPAFRFADQLDPREVAELDPLANQLPGTAALGAAAGTASDAAAGAASSEALYTPAGSPTPESADAADGQQPQQQIKPGPAARRRERKRRRAKHLDGWDAVIDQVDRNNAASREAAADPYSSQQHVHAQRDQHAGCGHSLQPVWQPTAAAAAAAGDHPQDASEPATESWNAASVQHLALSVAPTHRPLGGGPLRPAGGPLLQQPHEAAHMNHPAGRHMAWPGDTQHGGLSHAQQGLHHHHQHLHPQNQNNVVPGPGAAQTARQGVDEDDPRPIILFDLNGTLTQHTAARRSSGKSVMRPGTHHLLRLLDCFRLGIFTSSSPYTVSKVIPMLQAASQPGLSHDAQRPLFADGSLIFDRRHTQPAPAAHREAGGKEWDTVKPLSRLFQRLHRVLLVDDDAFKAVAGEEANMVRVPCWQDEDQHDTCIALLVDLLLETFSHLGPDADLRPHTANISQRLEQAAALAHSLRPSMDLPAWPDIAAQRDSAAEEVAEAVLTAAPHAVPAGAALANGSHAHDEFGARRHSRRADQPFRQRAHSPPHAAVAAVRKRERDTAYDMLDSPPAPCKKQLGASAVQLMANGHQAPAKAAADQHHTPGSLQNGTALLVTNMVMSEGVPSVEAFIGMSSSEEGEIVD